MTEKRLFLDCIQPTIITNVFLLNLYLTLTMCFLYNIESNNLAAEQWYSKLLMILIKHNYSYILF